MLDPSVVFDIAELFVDTIEMQLATEHICEALDDRIRLLGQLSMWQQTAGYAKMRETEARRSEERALAANAELVRAAEEAKQRAETANYLVTEFKSEIRNHDASLCELRDENYGLRRSIRALELDLRAAEQLVSELRSRVVEEPKP